MERTEMWGHIHRERAALAEQLADLSPADWSTETLCTGWSVLEVGAHVISHPQIRAGEVAGMLARNLGRRGYNQMTYLEVKRRARKETPESVLADFATYDGSTRTVPGTTRKEALIDVLLHTQDILRPLGRSHDMPPDAAAAAADRVRVLGWLTGWGARGVRLEATDVDWSHGEGLLVRGPMQELLMVFTGRSKAARDLEGDGLELLANR
ncbi:maleylpyruvate isomerase family mycothiol-dependent enzyme [Nocardioides seonyuensis]|uniref:Maleylpyruvate isomerase family mycothiol-dependent enzyme n=1 Tax=Nocardioides seonyuensis TaxID=2518371 RepID=A0A4P7IF97_9ACTN|nr:maleylpyruvate isomerase family mycothiol-dependent enzyme [Nocardioides seonyuensis]QBX54647.1 maleylpyruvate isomerase family mycothiol-dependent enzyme [Nocardioides seonyuensis]